MTIVNPALLRAYAEGMRDAYESVLKIILGQPVDGADPYTGPVPDELRAWATECLGRVQGDQTAVDDAVKSTLQRYAQ